MNGKKLLKDKDKKTKLPKIGKLQKDCDRRMQEIGKIIHPKSLISGQPTEVHHHFIPKSVSSALRYDWDNLIPLTNAEHCRIHQSEDPDKEMQIVRIKGLDWYNNLKAKSRNPMKINREYYSEVMEKLENHLLRYEL